VWDLARRIAFAIRDGLHPGGLTLFNGVAGWHSVFHFHVHLVPRWEGDGLTPPWHETPGEHSEIAAAAVRLRKAVQL
jgi:histidine triad (HIT) family protein